MIKKRLIALGVVGILTAGFTFGCSSTSDVENNNENNTAVEDTIVDNGNKEEEESDDLIQEKQELNIYSQDVNTDEEIVVSTIEVNKDDKIENILNQLGNKLSQDVFGNLPIELVEISENNGEKIAIINLRESDLNASKEDFTTYEGASWIVGYFQGSTGGTITTNSLLKTFLQSDNKELKNWIDGVQFLYNNNPISFEHVEKLSEVIMR